MSPVATTGTMKSLRDLLVEQLHELYSAEVHSESVLAKLAEHAVEPRGSKGLLEDCTSLAGRAKIDPNVRDAAIIAAMQRLEHDEIAGYGCARTWASLLGYPASASELLKTLTEERRFDEGLTRIAESLNRSALEPAAAAVAAR